ncbi:hypothetical protein ACH37Y_19160, partial [Sphingomonas paucimobilis]|uniref:hypothetical protein n=1 Tax=Sphingomonas paucimobilis TaxID=13689 RepID=UPI003791516C
MTRTEMLETMKRLDAHANALLLTGASDIDLLGGMFDVMPDFKALLDAGYGGEIDKNAGRFPSGAWEVIDRCIGRRAGTPEVEGPSVFAANPG